MARPKDLADSGMDVFHKRDGLFWVNGCGDFPENRIHCGLPLFGVKSAMA